MLWLGRQPLANALRTRKELSRPEKRYPLFVVFCGACSLVQLSLSVPPEVLFADYPYFSSMIAGLVANAHVLSSRMIDKRGLGPDSLVIEIASNDGYLLQHYRDAGIPVLGVEPAANVAAVAEERGISTRCAFFGDGLARELVDEGLRPDLVHANNVLAHVPDLNGFVAGIATLLQGRGRAVIETAYLKNLLDWVEFDTIYHEHLCYYSLTALEPLFARHELALENVEKIPIHGGSLRVTVAPAQDADPDESVARLLSEEADWGALDPATYEAFSSRVEEIGDTLRALLVGLKRDGARIAAYGAAAKGSTLLNTLGIGTETFDFCVDASPHKQGRYMPGSGLEIAPPARLLTDRPDYVLILAWNLADEIREQQQAYTAQGGRFILPIPEPRLL